MRKLFSRLAAWWYNGCGYEFYCLALLAIFSGCSTNPMAPEPSKPQIDCRDFALAPHRTITWDMATNTTDTVTYYDLITASDTVRLDRRLSDLADIDPAKACREASGSVVYLVVDGAEVVKTTD